MAPPEVDSEWEYEYDDNLTEAHYIVIDLPRAIDEEANASNPYLAQPLAPWEEISLTKPNTSRKRSTRKPPKGSSSKIVYEERRQPQETNQAGDVAVTPNEVEVTQAHASNPEHQEGNRSQIDDTKDQLQILGLHEESPLISYDGRTYTCRWTRAMGTDMLFAQRSGDKDHDTDREVLYPLPSWDLLGFGSARLMASRATLVKRDEPGNSVDSAFTGLDQTPVSKQSRVNQANFLNKLNALRVKMGERETAPPTVEPNFAINEPSGSAPATGTTTRSPLPGFAASMAESGTVAGPGEEQPPPSLQPQTMMGQPSQDAEMTG